MSSERARDIRDPIGLWRWLLGFTLVYIGLRILGAVLFAAIHTPALAETLVARDFITWGSIAYDLWPLFYLVCIVLTCLITYRMMKNLHELGSAQDEISPFWSVAYYFVPFANLIMPVQAVGQIWRGTFWHEERPRQPNGLIALWWASLLLALGIGIFGASGPTDTGEFKIMFGFDTSDVTTPAAAAASAVSGLAAVFFVNVFGPIARGQSKLIKTTAF